MSEILFYLIPIAFIFVVLYIFRPSAKKMYEEDGEIPFKGKELENSSSEEK